MKIGGYQIIDLENRNLTIGEGMQYKGLYEQIEGTRKPTLVSGIQIEGVELHDTFADFVPAGNSFVASVTVGGATATLTVTDLDVVTVTINE